MSAEAIAAIAIAVWLAVLVFVLALMRVAAMSDDAMARAHATEELAVGGATDVPGEDVRSPSGLLTTLLERSFRHDPAMGEHAGAVAHYARELAAAAKLPPAEQALAHTAGLLHGLGEPGFFDAVLAAEPNLDAATAGIIERHAALRARVLDEIPGMAVVADVIEARHEHVDGSGRPYGLRGDDIPRSARIVTIAETYDRLSAAGRARGGLPSSQIDEQLRQAAGHELDAGLVELFLTSVVQHQTSEPAPFRPSVARAFQTLRHAIPRHDR